MRSCDSSRCARLTYVRTYAAAATAAAAAMAAAAAAAAAAAVAAARRRQSAHGSAAAEKKTKNTKYVSNDAEGQCDSNAYLFVKNGATPDD